MGDIFEQAPAGKMFSRSGTQKLQMLLPIIPLGKRILGKADRSGNDLGHSEEDQLGNSTSRRH